MQPDASSRPWDEQALRAGIVAAGRRLRAGGLVAATEGNVSIRVGDALLITPSGRRKDELAPDDMLVVPLDAGADDPAVPGARPSSDVAIHRAAYLARPDVGAVVHAHLPASMALTLAGEIPDPAVLPETQLFLGRLPFVPFGAPGSAELAMRVADALAAGDAPLPTAVLLERHGAVAVGAGEGLEALDVAMDRLELVEVLCRTWRDALLVRGAAASVASTGDAGRAILRPPSREP